MALHIKLRHSNGLEICESIKEKIGNGEINTWSVDADGDFTYTSPQWINQAWFRYMPGGSSSELVLGIIGRKGVRLSKTIYAVYHGRFAEMLLTYFDDEMESIEITSLLESHVDFF